MYLFMLHMAVMKFVCMSSYCVWCSRNDVLCCSSLVSFHILKLHGTIVQEHGLAPKLRIDSDMIWISSVIRSTTD